MKRFSIEKNSGRWKIIDFNDKEACVAYLHALQND